MTSLTTFAFVLVPRFNMMALTAALEPLRVANYLTGKQVYMWEFLSTDGGDIVASNDMFLATEPLPDVDRRYDTVFVCSSWHSEHLEHKGLFAWLRRHDRFGTRLGSMDIGTYILARAGLLDGHTAAILWYCARAFSEEFPEVEAVETLFVKDQKRVTIAGGAAGIDMMLGDVGERLGADFAREVAEHILHDPILAGDTPQRRVGVAPRETMQPLLRKAMQIMEENVEDPLSIPELAGLLDVSQRKLERLFHKHVGNSVVGYYRVLRLQHARVMLTNTRLSVREISVACGYASLSHFAKSFSELFGRRPRDCRDDWPEGEPTPVWPGLSASLGTLAPRDRQV